LRALRPIDFSASRLPPRCHRSQTRGTSSYKDFTQAPTHSHLNLVGWVSMALYALVYRQYPAAAQSRFAMLHFWIANVGAMLLTVGIYTQMADMPSLAFIVISGSFITILGMLIFNRVFESLGSRRRVEAEFSSPFPADFSSPRR
jgi:hypothetical protein